MCAYTRLLVNVSLISAFNFRRAAFSTYHHLRNQLSSSELTAMAEKREAVVSGYISNDYRQSI